MTLSKDKSGSHPMVDAEEPHRTWGTLALGDAVGQARLWVISRQLKAISGMRK